MATVSNESFYGDAESLSRNPPSFWEAATSSSAEMFFSLAIQGACAMIYRWLKCSGKISRKWVRRSFENFASDLRLVRGAAGLILLVLMLFSFMCRSARNLSWKIPLPPKLGERKFLVQNVHFFSKRKELVKFWGLTWCPRGPLPSNLSLESKEK